MIQVEFQRNLIGLEDLLVGVGTEEQTRGPLGTTPVTVTKINSSNLPYDEDLSFGDKFDEIAALIAAIPTVVDQDGNLLTGLIDTSASDISATHTGRLWRKSVSSTEAHIYYGTVLLFKYDATSGDLTLNSPAILVSTSVSSLAIGTGSKTFATQAGKVYIPGLTVTAVSAADAANYMIGTLTSYNGSNLVVNVTSTHGSGTHADWNITVSSPTGVGDMLYSDNLASLANKGTSRTNLGVAIGTDVQAYSALLAAHAALSATSGTIEKTGAATVGTYTVTTAAKTVLDDTTTSAMRTTLGLGTSATLDVGTTASKVVQLTAAAKLPAVDGSLLTNLPSSGKILQSKYSEVTAWTTISAAIPVDDTIPQITEGTELFSNTITQAAAGNKIRITVDIWYMRSTSGADGVLAAFVDGGANAIAAAVNFSQTASTTNAGHVLRLVHEYSEADTSSHTITIRIGVSTGNLYLNGDNSSRIFGGVAKCTMLLEEIAA